MTDEKFIVALDQGTSSSRALAVAADGTVRAMKSAPLAPSRPGDGLSEYDAQILADSQLGVLNDLLDEIGPQNAAALAVTSQRSTVVLWDRQTGRAAAPVLTWEDGRALEEAQRAEVSQEEIHAVTGLYKTPYFSAPKIAWCLAHMPGAKEALKAGNLLVGPVASYLIWKLTQGKTFAADPTLAQRMLLLDIRTKTWSEELCRAFGVPSACLPEIRPSAADYGAYDYKGVRIPIATCAGDQQASVAFTDLRPGQTCINYGTGAFLLHNAGAAAPVFLPGMLTSLSASGADGVCDYLLEGPVNAAGSVFQWLNAQGITFDHREIDALCGEAKNPVWFLPALGGLGAPYWDYSVTPAFAGLSPRTRRADWVAGAARGVAFLLADIAAYLRAGGYPVSSPVRVSGGLSRVSYLMRFQADLLQAELWVAQEAESTVLGAARLTARQIGWNAGAWKEAAAERVLPSLDGAKAANLHQRWQAFVGWCKARPS